MVSVREVMLQARPPWLQETQMCALTHSTPYGPLSRLRCKLQPCACLCEYMWFSGLWSCFPTRFSSLSFKIKLGTLVLKVSSNGSSGGKQIIHTKCFCFHSNPLILPKLTLEMASVGGDSLTPPEPSSLFKYGKLNIFQEEAT